MSPRILVLASLVLAALQAHVLGQSGTLSVPSSDVETARREILEETFEIGQARTDAQKAAVIEELGKLIRDPGTSEDDVYIAVTAVLPIAASVGAWSSLQTFLGELGNYQLDFPAERARYSVDCLKAVKTATALDGETESIATAILETAFANRYEEADSLFEAAEQASRRLRSRVLSKLLPPLKRYLKDRQTAYESFAAARKELVAAPNSPTANAIVGKWLGVYEEDWASAYRHLVKCDDVDWKVPAMLLASGMVKHPSAALGDCWYDIAAKSSGTEQKVARRLARIHYANSLRDVGDSLNKARIQKRLGELSKEEGRSEADRKLSELLVSLQDADQPDEVSPATVNAAKPDELGPLPIGTRELPKAEWIDLLSLVKVPDHVLLGRWSRKGGELACEPSWDARVQVPVALAGSYEVEMEFTRRSNNEIIALVIPVGWTNCLVCVSAAASKYHGIENVKGRGFDKSTANSGLGVVPGILVNGQRYRLKVIVTVNEDAASVAAFLDGRQFAQWRGPMQDLSINCLHTLASRSAIGVTCHESATDLHSLQLRLLRGGKAYALGDDFDNPISRPADAPPREIAAQCLTWKGQKYYISDKGMPVSDAQVLAARLHGRLLTVSSLEEQEFLFKEGRGRILWTSGWKRTESDVWRDERNRPLSFLGEYVPGNPTLRYRELHLGLATSNVRTDRGWHDADPWEQWHACIEWDPE